MSQIRESAPILPMNHSKIGLQLEKTFHKAQRAVARFTQSAKHSIQSFEMPRSMPDLNEVIAPTATRVNVNTSDEINRQIFQQILSNIAFFVRHPQRIPDRLTQLDAEWDVERVLATGSTVLTVLGLFLAYAVSPYFAILSLAVQLFYLQHALQGWCPPLPLVRRLGFRTEKEIQLERTQLTTMWEQRAF